MSSPVELFGLATRGVNVVEAPTHLSVEEVTAAQNVEVVSDAGENALDQRPGMSKVNAVALSGAVVMAQDVPADALLTRTPTLYAGMYAGSTHNWRKSTDGTTWTNADVPVKPFSNNTANVLFTNQAPKCVTVAGRMYFCDGASPIALHAFDGVTDATVATVPPAVSGATLSAPPAPSIGANGSVGVTTYSYKVVPILAASHGPASSAGSCPGATLGDGTAGTTQIVVSPISPPVSGAASYDVYRTAGGATQGKVGTIPIVAGVFTTGNGSGGPFNFTDNGLVADGTTAPTTASGSTAGDAVGILDMITDGTSIYIATVDGHPGDPTIYGRILQFFPATGAWAQIGASFPTASGNGTPAALALYDGALTYGTYIGSTNGFTSYTASTGTPLPAGGIPEVHLQGGTFYGVSSIAAFNGDLYVGLTSMVAGTAALVIKRAPVATWTTSLTGPTTGVWNSFPVLAVFNGRLFTGFSSGAATQTWIYSTLDGVTWVQEAQIGNADFPNQMVVFQGALYIVVGRTGAAYNTTSLIYKRQTNGTWASVDNPSDDFAGCLGVVYV